MSTLTEFLLARIAEVEAAARAVVMLDYGPIVVSDTASTAEYDFAQLLTPNLVLAECKAKRQIVLNASRNRTDLLRDTDGYAWEVRVLAAIYSDHPDYDESWRP